jgi:hypothetical protein
VSSSITLDRTVKFVRRFIQRAPLTFVNTNDPAFLMGDWVRQFILSPPFAWRWNRATTQITCVVGQQDYEVNLPNFGWLEQASAAYPTGNQIIQLTVALDLEQDAAQAQPNKIAARLDDNNGNITFRIIPAPDQAYVLNISYQMSPGTFSSVNQTWAPIPDYLSYLYTNGMLAQAYQYWGDERGPSQLQLFVRQLVGANGGLSDTQANIFVADSINVTRTAQEELGTSQMGLHGRSLS